MATCSVEIIKADSEHDAPAALAERDARESKFATGEPPIAAAQSLIASCGALCNIFWWTGKPPSEGDRQR